MLKFRVSIIATVTCRYTNIYLQTTHLVIKINGSLMQCQHFQKLLDRFPFFSSLTIHLLSNVDWMPLHRLQAHICSIPKVWYAWYTSCQFPLTFCPGFPGGKYTRSGMQLRNRLQKHSHIGNQWPRWWRCKERKKEIPDPVRGGGYCHALRSITRGKQLAGDCPNRRATCACESSYEQACEDNHGRSGFGGLQLDLPGLVRNARQRKRLGNTCLTKS